MSKPLNIFDFSDYREFLRCWIEEAKAQKTSNLSRLAEVIGVHSTFLSHVLAGSKNLSLEQTTVLSEFLNQTKLEREYLFALLQFEKAGSHSLKKYWQEKTQEILFEKNNLSRRFDEHRELTDTDRAIFYSSWLYVGAFLASAISDGQNLDQIAKTLKLPRKKAEEILHFLVSVGICKEANGTFMLGDVHIHVPNESPFVVKHHTNWRMKAIQKMDSRTKEELFFTSPMSISKKDFEILREKLNLAIKEVVNVAKDSPAEEIVCLNIDFFRQD